MPIENSAVNIQYGTQQAYNNLTVKDSNTIYIITDNKRIYIGQQLYSDQDLDAAAFQKSLQVGLPHLIPDNMDAFDQDLLFEQGSSTWLFPGHGEINLNNSNDATQPFKYTAQSPLKFLGYFANNNNNIWAPMSKMTTFKFSKSLIKNDDANFSDVNFSGHKIIFENIIFYGQIFESTSNNVTTRYTPGLCFENDVIFKNCSFINCRCMFVGPYDNLTITFENCYFNEKTELKFWGQDNQNEIIKGYFKNCCGNNSLIGIYNNYTKNFEKNYNFSPEDGDSPSENIFNINFYLKNCSNINLDIRDSSNINIEDCTGYLYMSRVSDIYLKNCEITYFTQNSEQSNSFNRVIYYSATDYQKEALKQRAINAGGQFIITVQKTANQSSSPTYEQCGINNVVCGEKIVRKSSSYVFGLNGYTSIGTVRYFTKDTSLQNKFEAAPLSENQFPQYVPVTQDDQDIDYYKNGFTKVQITDAEFTDLIPYENHNIVFENCVLTDKIKTIAPQYDDNRIIFTGCKDLIFKNCVLSGNFVMFNIQNLLIQGCNIRTRVNGFCLYSIDQGKITNSNIVRHLENLYLYCSDKTSFKNKETKTNRVIVAAIQFSNVKQSEFSNNSYNVETNYSHGLNTYSIVDLYEVYQREIIDILMDLPSPRIFVDYWDDNNFIYYQYENNPPNYFEVKIWDDDLNEYAHSATQKILFIKPDYDYYTRAWGQSSSIKFDTDKLALINLNNESSLNSYSHQFSNSKPICIGNLYILKENNQSGYNCYSWTPSTLDNLDDILSPFTNDQLFTTGGNISGDKIGFLYMTARELNNNTLNCTPFCLNPLVICSPTEYNNLRYYDIIPSNCLFAVVDNGTLTFKDNQDNTYTINGAASSSTPAPAQNLGNSLILTANTSAITPQATVGNIIQDIQSYQKSPLIFKSNNVTLQDITIEGNGGNFVLPTYEKQNVNITWESGSINSSDGSFISNTVRIRTNAIPVSQIGTYALKIHFSPPLVPGQIPNYNSVVYCFDENDNYVESSFNINNSTWYENHGVLIFNITNNATKKIRINMAQSDYSSNIYPSLISSSELLLQTNTVSTQYLTIGISDGINSQTITTNIQSLASGESISFSDLNINIANLNIPTSTGDNIITIGIDPSPYVIFHYQKQGGS